MLNSAFLLAATSAGDIIQNSANKSCGSNCGPSLLVIFKDISNALFIIIGAVSVIMIIIGGLKMVTSQGDPKNIESGRNTILYAVIGVIVAIASYGIVTFVISRF